jgi:hypothetical protein
MIAVALILSILIPLTIVGWTIWRIKKSGRAPAPALLLGSVLLTVNVIAFAIFSTSLDRADREQWSKYFPGGTHALALIVCTCVIAVVCIADRFLKRPKRR